MDGQVDGHYYIDSASQQDPENVKMEGNERRRPIYPHNFLMVGMKRRSKSTIVLMRVRKEFL